MGADEFSGFKPRAVPGPADRTLLRLEKLVDDHGPEVAARRWAELLGLEEARAFATVFGLAHARRLARERDGMRRLWEMNE